MFSNINSELGLSVERKFSAGIDEQNDEELSLNQIDREIEFRESQKQGLELEIDSEDIEDARLVAGSSFFQKYIFIMKI